MQIARVLDGERIVYGIIRGDQLHLIQGSPFGGIEEIWEQLPLSQLKLLAPCVPSKVVCVGLNYRDHAEEMKLPLPKEPLFFLKPPSALLEPGGTIDYPRATKDLQYEAELAIIIDRPAHRITAKQAHTYIFGYTCANDVSARDLQKLDGQWTRAKSFDTFLPLGPWIETAVKPDKLAIRLLLNGEVKQSSNTEHLIHRAYDVVAAASQIMTLMPGDVVLTGTPSGVGPMQIGDTVGVEIEGIGRLENRVGIV